MVPELSVTLGGVTLTVPRWYTYTGSVGQAVNRGFSKSENNNRFTTESIVVMMS